MTSPENNLNDRKDCTACGLSDCPFLFPVRHRAAGLVRRFCTACILKTNTGSFCPICFAVFDDSKPIPSHLRVICFNCSSVCHLSCVNPSPASSSARYRCPPCSGSNFSFFDVSGNKKFKSNGGVAAPGTKSINEYLAKQLLAAAQIAANSMNKAAAAQRLEAEKRVKEAAVARRRAVEALAHLAAKEKSELTATEVADNNNSSQALVPFNWGQVVHKSNNNAHLASSSSNWAQNRLPDKSPAPPRSNAASVLPETVKKDGNGR